jgi:N-acetylmuramoyl-L-alanine amidase
VTLSDQFVLALTCWRENRGGGWEGMQSVANVVMNRAAHRKTSPYAECVRPWQFSSLTAKGDPELVLWPGPADTSWQTALSIAQAAADGTLEDITEGATSYYALSMKTPPYWAATMSPTVTIKNQKFFK